MKIIELNTAIIEECPYSMPFIVCPDLADIYIDEVLQFAPIANDMYFIPTVA